MANSFFFLQADKTHLNQFFITAIEQLAENSKEQIYIISKPLGDVKYTYDFKDGLVVLSPRRKLSFINFSNDESQFNDFVEDFLEDLASLSDKYRYKEFIGRPRIWKEKLIEKFNFKGDQEGFFNNWNQKSNLQGLGSQRIVELLTSLLTGSINDIERVKVDPPTNILDMVKRKILLFDGDQTRFIYEKPAQKVVRIQGLSGTGKTELLLHKLRDLYVNKPSAKIAFTCHNKILADNLAKRIPEFFDFMKVEQQISWNERLWCFHAWGSAHQPNSGMYSLICNHYELTFQRYSRYTSFDQVCKQALSELKSKEHLQPCLDYVLIDESQDFPDAFFDLCELITKEGVYIAGDIFQGIFDDKIIDAIEPDYLLSKCYRTDPRTLMFSHAIGMGLFEEKKLRWLEDKEWAACGYIVHAEKDVYRLSREPLRRFEDIDSDFPSVEIDTISGDFWSSASSHVVSKIEALIKDHPSLTQEDIGVIILDNSEQTYRLADELSIDIPRKFAWKVNKAHETKRRQRGALFVSNRNNVKGLEFPFIICVTNFISNSLRYRNALYMTLTRSFIQSHLIVSDGINNLNLQKIKDGLQKINQTGNIEAIPPTPEEQKNIKTAIHTPIGSESFFEVVEDVFDELQIIPLMRQELFKALKIAIGEDFDRENIKETASYLYQKMMSKG
ncbi:DEAD/DEAH box helicase [Rivihabitans pingtungensis]|uniref:DEAD/DEAH box helicase n=1 Tax=Rivihabitans pingtungensis TaxID=1054498 RepID=UPI002357784C|nr:AAA family ATPase [Rivihabitans pingtungensis]MCK6436544.1 AAA family ATPase [Rivihabitans pingtungensis]